MSRRKPLTIIAPIQAQELTMPRALNARLHELLDKQDIHGTLTTKERREAAALVELSELISLLRLCVKATNDRG